MSKDFLKVKNGLTFPGLTADPSDSQNGDFWYRSDLQKWFLKSSSTTNELTVGGSGGGIQKIDLVDAIVTTLPTGASATIDGVSVANNMIVLFTNLSSGANQVYKASGVGSSISWTAQTIFAQSATPTSGDLIWVKQGSVFGNYVLIFTTAWYDFTQVINVFDNGLIVSPRTLPGSPVNGMLVVDSADNKLKKWDGSAWVDLEATGSALPTFNNNIVIISDGSGNLTSSSVTVAELNALSGYTGSLSTDIPALQSAVTKLEDDSGSVAYEDNFSTALGTYSGSGYILASDSLKGTSVSVQHHATLTRTFADTFSLGRKYRNRNLTVKVDVISSATQGNLTFKVENQSIQISTTQQVTTGSIAFTGNSNTVTGKITGISSSILNSLKLGATVSGANAIYGSRITAINPSEGSITLDVGVASTASGATFRASTDTVQYQWSFTPPFNSTSLTYTFSFLPEANAPRTLIDNISFELTEMSNVTTSVTVPKNNNYSGQIQSGIIIGAITTAPTKGTTSVDRIIHSRIENRLLAEYQYKQSAIGSTGSGDYLFSLPGSLQFDLTAITPYTGTLFAGADYSASVVGTASMVNASSLALTGSAVAYSSTQFRIIGVGAGANGGTSLSYAAGSTGYSLSDTSNNYNIRINAPISGWTTNETETKTLPLTSSVLIVDPDSYLRINASAGTTLVAGSTANKILSFANCTVQENIGTAIQYLDDSINAARFVAQKEGLFRFHFSADLATTTYFTGFSKNASSVTTSIMTLANSERLNISYDGSSAAMLTVSAEAYLKVGDIVRVHTDGPAINTSTAPNLIVSYQGSTKILNPSTDQKVSFPIHHLRFEGCSGRGSTDTAILKFDTQASITGDGMEVLNTASNGTVITIKKAGLLSVTANADVTSTTTAIYISKNQSNLNGVPSRPELLVGNIGDVPLCTTIPVPVAVGDKIRAVASGSVVGDYPMAVFSLTLMETSVGVALQNVTPTYDNSDSAVRVTVGAGFGSTNTNIRRFANNPDNQGTDVLYTDSATLGGFFTINTTGLYSGSYTEQNTGANNPTIFILKNSTSSVVSPFSLGSTTIANQAGNNATASFSNVYLQKGDVIRAYADVPAAIASSSQYACFTIGRVGKTSGTVDITPFINIPSQDIDAIEIAGPSSPNGMGSTYTNNLRFTGTRRNTNRGVIQFVDDATTGSYIQVIKDCQLFLSYSGTFSASAINFLITRNQSTSSAPANTERVAMAWSAANGEIEVSVPVQALAGDKFRIYSSSTSLTRTNELFQVLAIAQSTSVATQTQQVSSDTMGLGYKATAIDTTSDPIGTYNIYTYASSSNVKTLGASAPSQLAPSMNTNGIQLQTRGSWATATGTAIPARIDIFIGKGFESVNYGMFKDTAGTIPLSIDAWNNNTGTSRYGSELKGYSKATGILTVDLAYNSNAAATSWVMLASDNTEVSTGYLRFSASKTPSLVTIPNLNQRSAYLSDIKAVASGGGSSVAGTWTTRDLNTIYDPTGIVSSLTSNLITLPAGTYEFDVSAPFCASSGCEAATRIQNITDGTTVDYGTDYCTTNANNGWVKFSCQTTITSAKVFAVQTNVGVSTATYGYGQNGTLSGVANTFTKLKITKVK